MPQVASDPTVSRLVAALAADAQAALAVIGSVRATARAAAGTAGDRSPARRSPATWTPPW